MADFVASSDWERVLDHCAPAVVALRITTARAFVGDGAGTSEVRPRAGWLYILSRDSDSLLLSR